MRLLGLGWRTVLSHPALVTSFREGDGQQAEGECKPPREGPRLQAAPPEEGQRLAELVAVEGSCAPDTAAGGRCAHLPWLCAPDNENTRVSGTRLCSHFNPISRARRR